MSTETDPTPNTPRQPDASTPFPVPSATPPAPIPPPPAFGASGSAQPDPSSRSTVDLQPLDPRVIKYWRIQSLIASAILLFILLFVGGIVLLNVPEALPIVVGVWFAMFVLRLWILVWYPGRCYRAWSYRLDDKVLETRQGIWFRVVTLVPLSRLQHVDLHRGPLERSLGLASLLLQTAGTQNATIVIPGLDANLAPQLRDRLVAAGGDDAV